MSDTASIDYTFQVWREGNQYVAHVVPLDVVSAGTLAEVLQEAVYLYRNGQEYFRLLDHG